MELKAQIIFCSLLSFITIEASWLTKRECDEVITGPVGVLQFTDPYKALQSWTLYCEYNITVDGQNGISLTIPSMSINSPVNSTDCGDSYINLKNGLDIFATPLGRGKYCGNEEVGPLITTGNKLNIRTVIELGLGAHYMIKYQREALPCGGIFELTPGNLTKVIKEEGSSISECIWIFIAPAGHALSIIPEKCDHVSAEMRNGGTNVSPLISQSCSNERDKIITTDNLLYVKIHPNNKRSWELNSFQAHITAVEASCGGTLRVDNGVIISPNYPFNSPNKVCTWKIITPRNKRIQFEFQDLHLSDSSNCEQRNYLRISERMLENGTHRILGTLCGSTKPNIIRTSCNKAKVEFRSDYHNIGHFRGFVLNFTTINEPCVVDCGGFLTSDNGIISSPNFPDDYQSNQLCQWKIHLSSEKKIKFQFVRVIIDESPSCNEDYVMLTENINGTDNNLGVYCNDSNTMPILTSSSVAEVIFRSNDKNEDSGFLLTYSAIEGSLWDTGASLATTETSDMECGGLLTESRGTIDSPFELHGQIVDCEWTIKAPFHKRIYLQWKIFKMSYGDYVKIKKKSRYDVYVDAKILDYNMYLDSIPEMSYRDSVQIIYHSDGNDEDSDFSVSYYYS